MDKVENLTGFVALIDILGFRELVNRANDLSQVRNYIDTVANRLDQIQYAQLQYVLFSDNLVINTTNDSWESFRTLIRACSDIFFDLLQSRIAVRGAVSKGSFMRSPNTQQGVIVAGRPIVEADYYQHSQDWVGIMLTPSVVRDNDTLQQQCLPIDKQRQDESTNSWLDRNFLRLRLMRWPEIPFHTDGSARENFSGFVICPMHSEASTIDEAIKSVRNTIMNVEFMKTAAPNPASQHKYSASSEFFQKVQMQLGMTKMP